MRQRRLRDWRDRRRHSRLFRRRQGLAGLYGDRLWQEWLRDGWRRDKAIGQIDPRKKHRLLRFRPRDLGHLGNLVWRLVLPFGRSLGFEGSPLLLGPVLGGLQTLDVSGRSLDLFVQLPDLGEGTVSVDLVQLLQDRRHPLQVLPCVLQVHGARRRRELALLGGGRQTPVGP